MMFWSLVIFSALISPELCVGETSCVFWSSAGSVVRWGSTFRVYCTVNCKCKRPVFNSDPPQQQSHKHFNSSTIYLDVVNITNKRTYSCQCNCQTPQDPCGLDIAVGYPPDPPNDISCTYEIQNSESGEVTCTWNRGRDTLLRDHFQLWAGIVSGNITEGPGLYNVSTKGSERPSVTFRVSRWAQLISVRVHARNPLGSAESLVVDYTLGEIVKPSQPDLGQVKCSTRKCFFVVQQSLTTSHLQVQYKSARQREWTTVPDSDLLPNTSQLWSVSSLDPYTLYYFRVRSRFSRGLWSSWSSSVSSQTQEDVPSGPLDMWVVPAHDSKSEIVYWKEPDTSVSRGRITRYTVRVRGPNRDDAFDVSADARNLSVPFCRDCEVILSAHNSKGESPPTRMRTTRTEAAAPLNVSVTVSGNNVSLSWGKPRTAPVMYVLEWLPQGGGPSELQWVKLSPADSGTVIPGIKPSECYEGSVFAFYNQNLISRTKLEPFATSEAAPLVGPSFKGNVEGSKATIDWTELPRAQRMGCIRYYTIYIKNKTYTLEATKRTFVMESLSPGQYTVQMSASTAKGEGPLRPGKILIYPEDNSLLLLPAYVAAAVVLLLFLCLCQSSAAKQRLLETFGCSMLDVVPDPANSKWAQECTKEKRGKMTIHLLLDDAVLMDKEEETKLVDVEFSNQSSNCSSSLTVCSACLQEVTGLSRTEEQTAPLYPPFVAYIKSISQDSDSSTHKENSMSTDSTDSYILSDAPGHLEEGDEDDEEEDPFAETPRPCTFFKELMQFEGMLTLDVVKIDCGELQIS